MALTEKRFSTLVYLFHILDYEDVWWHWQHTPLSESNTNGERLWFKSSDTDTNFWARIQWLLIGGHQYRTPEALHKTFPERPGLMLSRGRQNMCRRLWHTPRISWILAGVWRMVCDATAGTKTALDIHQLRFNYFAGSFFNALGVYFSRKAQDSGFPTGSSRTPGGPKQGFWGPEMWFYRVGVCMSLDKLFTKENEIYESLQVLLLRRILSNLIIPANVTY